MPVHLHSGLTTACPEMFLVLPFNMTLNILSGLKIQDSIHLLKVSGFFFPFLFIYIFHFLLHSSCIFCRFLDFFFFLKNTTYFQANEKPECQTQSISPLYLRFLGHLQELANASMLQTAGLLNYTVSFLPVHVGIVPGRNPPN